MIVSYEVDGGHKGVWLVIEGRRRGHGIRRIMGPLCDDRAKNISLYNVV